MSVGVSVKVKRWGVRALIALAVLWVLWVVSGQPWVPYGLWRDAARHEALFRQAAGEILLERSVEPGPAQKALTEIGYRRFEVEHGVVLFYRHHRFRGKGILGLAYSPNGQVPESLHEWAWVHAVPPHWEWKRMPPGFYIFGGR